MTAVESQYKMHEISRHQLMKDSVDERQRHCVKCGLRNSLSSSLASH